MIVSNYQRGRPPNTGETVTAVNLADLTAALSGIELGAYDKRIIAWLAQWEPSTVAVVSRLVRRARAAGLEPAEARTIVTALAEAADDKRGRAAHCADCDDQSCGTCQYRLRSARAYDGAADRLLATGQARGPASPDHQPERTRRRRALGCPRGLRGRAMTSTGRTAPANGGTRISLARRIAGWVGTRQQALSDRAHANGDAHAVARGWIVTASTGRLGFGARTYRDPRLDSLRRQGRPEVSAPDRSTSRAQRPRASGWSPGSLTRKAAR